MAVVQVTIDVEHDPCPVATWQLGQRCVLAKITPGKGRGLRSRANRSRLDQADILERQLAYRLAGRGMDGVENGRCDHADRRLADAAPEVTARHDDRFHLRHLRSRMIGYVSKFKSTIRPSLTL